MRITSNNETVNLFCELVSNFSYEGKGDRHPHLRELTFWTGAGFSKAWWKHAPLVEELFEIPSDDLEPIVSAGPLYGLIGETSGNIGIDEVRDLLFRMDVFERYPDLRSRYFDEWNARGLRNAIARSAVGRMEGTPILERFEGDGSHPSSNLSQDQQHIVRFFRKLKSHIDGSPGFANGLRYHFVSLNYDFVIESILRHTYEIDDSFLIYTYRGFTPLRINGNEFPIRTPDHWLVMSLLKLNGGAEIYDFLDGYEVDYRRNCARDESNFSPTPQIIMPTREQNYNTPYHKAVLPKAVRLMRDTHILVIVGYSLPDDDALMRFVLRQFAETVEDGRDKFIFFIGIEEDRDNFYKLRSLYPWTDGICAPRMFFYGGGFSSFANDCRKILC